MKKVNNNKALSSVSDQHFLWGLMLVVATLVASLSAYYTYSPIGRQFAFALMVLSVVMLFWSMAKDLTTLFTYQWVAWIILAVVLIFYFSQRLEFPRFDFMVGDASDYFAAGLCSVTYSQDIGYILPLSATITAVGYEIFGIENILLGYVILYATSIPIFYYLFRKLELTALVSFLMSILLILVPLSLWFSKTSFTEPIWQVLLFVFVINMYMVLQKSTLDWKNLIAIYAILFLAPMLRVEGVFYYGLLIFLALYHFWKYENIKVSLLLSLGLFIVAVSTHITLRLRPDYMLNRQFNRIIPHATEENVMMALYAFAGILIGLVILVYFLQKWFQKVPFSASIVVLTLLVKGAVAYVYAIKKHMTFAEMLFMNEYDIVVGNFGIPIALLIVVGLAILYYKAFKGEILPLILVVVYTIFYLPFAMQAVTFVDPHAFFMYWNRYYFSVLMSIHLLSLGLVFQMLYGYLQKMIENKKVLVGSFVSIFILISLFSMNIKLYQIVVHDSHLKGTHKLYSWVKNHVGTNGIYIVTEDGVVYKQNARPDGLEKIEYLIGRMFSLHKVPERGHEVIDSERFSSPVNFRLPNKSNVKYILCVGKQVCQLENARLSLVDTLDIPLEWREHFGLDKNASSIHQGDITKSVVQKSMLKASLYKVGEKFSVGKKASLTHNTVISSQLLGEGWNFINNRSSAFSPEGKGTIVLPKIKRLKDKVYHISLRYAVINASEKSVKTVNFSLANGKILKTVTVNSHTTSEVELVLPNTELDEMPKDVVITMESSNQGQIMLRTITMNMKGK